MKLSGLGASCESGVFTQAVFQPGDDELHLAGGIGVAFDNLQIDLGVSASERVDVAAISAIYSF